MLRFSNIRIGVKLALMSGISVVLMIGMIVASMRNNALVQESNDTAMLRQEIARGASQVELAFVGIRLALRNVRLATTMDELNAANDLETREKSADKLIDEPRLPCALIADDRDELRRLKLDRAADDLAERRERVAAPHERAAHDPLRVGLRIDPDDRARSRG